MDPFQPGQQTSTLQVQSHFSSPVLAEKPVLPALVPRAQVSLPKSLLERGELVALAQDIDFVSFLWSQAYLEADPALLGASGLEVRQELNRLSEMPRSLRCR